MLSRPWCRAGQVRQGGDLQGLHAGDQGVQHHHPFHGAVGRQGEQVVAHRPCGVDIDIVGALDLVRRPTPTAPLAGSVEVPLDTEGETGRPRTAQPADETLLERRARTDRQRCTVHLACLDVEPVFDTLSHDQELVRHDLPCPDPMTVVTPRAAPTLPVTAEELAEVPEAAVRRELVDGVVRTTAPAGGLHGETGNSLGHEITAHVRKNRLGTVFTAETGRIRRSPDTVRAPDVAFVRGERGEAARVPGFPDLAPDLVAEAVSPSDRSVDVVGKALAWLDAGVRTVWAVDRANRLITVHLPDSTTTLRGNAVLDGGDVLPGSSLALDDLWG